MQQLYSKVSRTQARMGDITFAIECEDLDHEVVRVRSSAESSRNLRQVASHSTLQTFTAASGVS